MATNGSTNGTVALIGSEPLSSQVLKIVASVVVLIVALVGNILIIVVVHKNTSMRKTINYFIVNMAVSDFIVPLVTLPRIIIETATSAQGWLATTGPSGEFLCKIMYFLSDITMVVSIFSLICIAVDRFCAVVFPLKLSLITSRVRLGLIAFTWVFSALYYSPLLYGMKLQPDRYGQTHCILRWSEDLVVHHKVHKVFVMTTTVLYIIIPAVLLTILYSAILVVVRLKIVSLQEQQGKTAQHRRAANNTKLLKLALLTVGVFAICYGPFNVFVFYCTIILDWRITDVEFFYKFTFAVQFLAYTNSALNPCIYFIFIENYRRGLMRVFKRGPPQRTDTLTDSSRLATKMLRVNYTRNPKQTTMERDGTVERETLIES